jgi:hypothetical protein
MMVNATNKNIEFLSDGELIEILKSVLQEIDIVVSSGAHRSTTFLAVSAIEGLFGEIMRLKKIPPVNKKGKPTTIANLTLEEREPCL